MKRQAKQALIKFLFLTHTFEFAIKIRNYYQHRLYLRFYSTYLPTHALVFDIGSNVGDRTVIFRELGARVIAVEPQSECVQMMLKRKHVDSEVIALTAAVGASNGWIDIHINKKLHPLSSCNPDWIKTVITTNRFQNSEWDGTRRVPMITLNEMIEAYGLPDFIKIDVEGYEHEVLAGLNSPIHALSFEFTPGYTESAERCLSRLTELGMGQFNYSIGETMRYELQKWVGKAEMCKVLRDMPDTALAGDIYARFKI